MPRVHAGAAAPKSSGSGLEATLSPGAKQAAWQQPQVVQLFQQYFDAAAQLPGDNDLLG